MDKIDLGLAYFDYYRQSKMRMTLDALIEIYQEAETKNLDQKAQIDGLIDSIGMLQSRQDNTNILITALITMMAEEEITLTSEYIQDILDRRLYTEIKEAENDGLTCTVKIEKDEDAN